MSTTANAMADLAIFAGFFGTLDHTLDVFVQSAVVNMAKYATPLIRTFGVLVFIGAGINLFWSPLPGAITKYGQTLALIAIITNIATVPATYNALLGHYLRALPDDLLTALDPQGMESAANIGKYMDLKVASLLQGVVDMWGAAYFPNVGGILLSLSMFAILCLLCVSMTITVSFAKIGMALVVAVGPLMLVSLISPLSRDFFSKWVSYCLMLAMLQMLIGGVMLIASSVLDTYAAVLANGGSSANNLSGMFAPATVMFVLTYLFSQLPSIASSLTGGIGLSAGNLMWDTLSSSRGGGGDDGGDKSGGNGGSVSNASGGGGGGNNAENGAQEGAPRPALPFQNTVQNAQEEERTPEQQADDAFIEKHVAMMRDKITEIKK